MRIKMLSMAALTLALSGVAIAQEDEAEFTDSFPLDDCHFVPWGGNDYFNLTPGRRSFYSNMQCLADGECDELEELRITVTPRVNKIDIDGETTLREDFVRMREQLTPLGGGDLVVQRMAGGGVACVLSTVEDPLFGPVVSFGLAGDATDLLGDLSHRIPPLTEVDVADLVRSVRAAPKLFGHRGARPVDVAALEDLVTRISCLADDRPEVAELSINPVVVTDRGVAVLGASVRLAHPPGRTDSGRRELTSVG